MRINFTLLFLAVLFLNSSIAQDTFDDAPKPDPVVDFRDGEDAGSQFIDLVFSKKANSLARDLGIYVDHSSSSFRIAIVGRENEPITWRIFDMSGRFAKQGKQVLEAGENNFQINVNNLSKGIYILIVKVKDEVLNKKIMVW